MDSSASMIPAFFAPRQESFDHGFDPGAAPAHVGEPFTLLGLEISDDVVADFVDGGIKVLMLGRGIGVEPSADDVDLGAEDVAFLVMGAGLAEFDIAHDRRIAADQLVQLGNALIYISGDRGSERYVRAFDAGVHGEKWLEIGNQMTINHSMILYT